MSEQNTPHWTAYQKFLKRLRDKIEGKAWEAVLNQDDPSRFKQLDTLHADPKVKKRLYLLSCLYGLESKTERTPFDTWLAILLAGQARVPAPKWAVRRMEEIGDGRMHKTWGLKNKTLDQAFGFPREARERMILFRYDGMFREVWVLTLLGFASQPACLMAARRYQRDLAERDRKRFYGEWRLGQGKKSGLEETLRKTYKAWLTANDAVNKRVERHWLTWLETHREEYLRQFPLDSWPKASLVEGARRRFDKKISTL